LVLTLDPGTGEPPLQVSKLDVAPRHGFASLAFQLTQAFSSHLAQVGAWESDLQRLSLAVFYDPHLHGDAHQPDLRRHGARPARSPLGRAQLFEFGLRRGTTARPDAVRSRPTARDEHAEAAALFSLAVDTSQARLVHAVRPRPHSTAARAACAVAGAFYPADPQVLQALVEESLGPEQSTRAVVRRHGAARRLAFLGQSRRRRLPPPRDSFDRHHYRPETYAARHGLGGSRRASNGRSPAPRSTPIPRWRGA